MASPKVSVIIPCYNQSKLIKDALNSVLGQTYDNWEVIIVDDGSEDNLEVAVKPFLSNPAVRFLKKENGGLSSARNYGIRHSKGEFILPLDADDKIDTTYISKAIAEFSRDHKVKLVYARAHYFGENEDEWEAADYDFEKLYTENLIFCSALFRRSDFDKAGGYREELKYGREDWDLWLRLLDTKSKVVKIPEVLFYYRKHRTDSMSDKFLDNKLNNIVLMDLYYFNKELYMNRYGNPITLIQEFEHLRDNYDELSYQYKALKNTWYNRLAGRIKRILGIKS